MKTYNKCCNNNGLKFYYKTKILMVGLLMIFQMAGAQKNETAEVINNDSVFCNSNGNEMAFIYNFSASETKAFTKASKNYFEIEVENPLKLEDWMIEVWMPDEKYLENLFFTGKESDLNLEKWMSDDQYWKVDR